MIIDKILVPTIIIATIEDGLDIQEHIRVGRAKWQADTREVAL